MKVDFIKNKQTKPIVIGEERLQDRIRLNSKYNQNKWGFIANEQESGGEEFDQLSDTQTNLCDFHSYALLTY
jgi:hypothetical protein